MSISILASLGVAAAVINAISFLPYIKAILRGKTRPERSSWWIWSVLMIVALAAQLDAGATWSTLLTVVFLVGNIAVAILSLRHGYGRFALKDWLSLLVVAGGLWLWKVTRDPLIALCVTVAVDFIGNWLTALKAWRAPYTENLPTWVMMSIAALLSALSVGELSVTKLLFPVYIVLANGTTFFIIVYRRHWRSEKIRAGLRRKRQVRPTAR